MNNVWVPSKIGVWVCVCVNHRIPEGEPCYGSYLSFVAPLTPLHPIGRRSLEQVQDGHWDMTQGNGSDPERCRKWGDELEKDNWEDEKACPLDKEQQRN